MKRRSVKAQVLEDRYIEELSLKLKVYGQEEANECLQDVREHIEAALGDMNENIVRDKDMSVILDQLGSVDDFIGENAKSTLESVSSESVSPQNLKRKGLSLSSFLLALLLLIVLGLTFVFWYSPASQAPLKATHFQPSQNTSAQDVTYMAIDFNGSIRKESLHSNTFKIEPPLLGGFELKGNDQIVFHPKEALSKATRYTILWTNSLRGVNGEEVLAGQYSFETQRPRVLKIRQSEIRSDRSTILEISFNDLVDPRQVSSFIKVSQHDGGGMAYTLLSSMPTNKMKLRLPFTKTEEIRVSVSRGFGSISGPLLSENDLEQTLHLSQKLVFQSMRAEYSGGKPRIRLNMNSPIDLSNLSDYIQVNPPVDISFSANYSGAMIQGDFTPGKRYRIKLREGLSAGAAGYLKEGLERSIWFPDVPEHYQFALKGGVVPPNAENVIPIFSTNVKKVRLEGRKLMRHNLVEYVLRGEGTLSSELSHRNYFLKLDILSQKNKSVESVFKLEDLFKNSRDKPGIYSINLLKDKDYYWKKKNTIIRVSDLGISVKKTSQQLVVWILSLSSVEPIESCQVSLYSNKRRLLKNAFTDEKGVVTLESFQLNPEEHASLIVVEKGEDLNYLRLGSRGLNRKIAGLPKQTFSQEHYDIYAFPERGLYRPGDTVFMTGMIRGKNWQTPHAFPIEIVIYKPSGKILKSMLDTPDSFGRITSSYKAPMHLPSGNYRVSYSLPGRRKNALGSFTFRIEDFIPQTLSLNLEGQNKLEGSRSVLKIDVKAKHLFGAPGAGLKAQAQVKFISSDVSFLKYPKYKFNDSRVKKRSYGGGQQKLVLDKNGQGQFSYSIPTGWSCSIIKARAEVDVLESGGRAIVDGFTLDHYNWKDYLGVRLDPKLISGHSGNVHLISIDKKGAFSSGIKKGSYQIVKVTYSYVLRKNSQKYLNYIWERNEKVLVKGDFEIKNGPSSFYLNQKMSGSYRLIVQAPGCQSSMLDFFVQGKGVQWNAKGARVLKMNLSQSNCKIGEFFDLQINSPFDGTALLTVERDRVLETHHFQIKGGEHKITLQTKENWRPNVYLGVTLIRSSKPEDQWKPHRASGMVMLKVDSSSRKLDIQVDIKKAIEPSRLFSADIRVSSLKNTTSPSALIFAAVDSGILNISQYKTPEPWEYFYGPRGPVVHEVDMYEDLAPLLKKWTSRSLIKTGGGGRRFLEKTLSRHLNPILARRVHSAVIYAGSFTTDEKGFAHVEFRAPEFIGEMRVMVFALREKYFGTFDQKIKVRSELMVKDSWPRFCAPGDTFEAALSVINDSTSSGNVRLSFDIQGPLQLGEAIPSISLRKGETKELNISFKAFSVGVAKIRLRANLGEHDFEKNIEIPIRPAIKFWRDSQLIEVNVGEKKEFTFPSDFFKGSDRHTLSITSNPLSRVAKSAQELIRYPYGCAEQTTSKLIPLLYMNDLLPLISDKTHVVGHIEDMIASGMNRLSMMQTYRGGLAMWPGSERDSPYVSIYATHILVEARKANWEVPSSLIRGLLGYLKRSLNSWTSEKSGKEHVKILEAAYACYVLSIADTPPYSSLSRLEEEIFRLEKKSEYVPASAKFFLAGALLAAGEKEGAKELLQASYDPVTERSLEGNFSSPIREKALRLSLLLDISKEDPQIPRMANELSLVLGNNLSTQENAFIVMALGKLARTRPQGKIEEISLLNAKGEVKSVDPIKGMRIKDIRGGQSFQLSSKGSGKIFVLKSSEGIPLQSKEFLTNQDSGCQIRKVIKDMQGHTLDLSEPLIQGQLYQIMLELESGKVLKNIVISDLLPGGLEIENDELKGSSQLQKDSNRGLRIAQRERKDDRLLIFADMWDKKASYSYILRAVSSGNYILPQADLSCMYDPSIFSRGGGGRILIQKNP